MPSGVSVTLYDAACLILQKEGEGEDERHFSSLLIYETIHIRGTMRTTNPFADDAPTDLEDRAFVERARAGDREALEELVRHHQGWIYNIALRMVFYPQDAEDATQEILLKAVTSLSSFEGRSSFRTWLRTWCASTS